MTRFSILFLFLLCIFWCDLRAQTINPPTELEAQSEDSSYIKVKWRDNSGNEEGFFIERTQINDSVYWEIIDVVNQNTTQYFDYWVTRGIKYYYRVFAYSGQLRSGYSNIDSAVLQGDPTIIPSAPTNLIVLAISEKSITIKWNDNSVNENGFIIARKSEEDLFYHYIDTVGSDVLTYQEVGLTPDHIYIYKVCSFNQFGISDYSNTVSARTKNTFIIQNSTEIPDKYFLGDNFPNPFNPSTNIKFGIKTNAFVELVIYNSVGAEVEKLIEKNLPAGTYQVNWNGRNFPSGVLFYKFTVNTFNKKEDFTQIKKMILIK